MSAWNLTSIENNGYNFINDKGDYLSPQWYDDADEFYEGFAWVYLYDKGFNFINEANEYISDIWYDDVNCFSEGFAAVYLSGRGWNFIDKSGRYKFDEWYEGTYNFHNGYSKVYIHNLGWNLMDKEGRYASDKWYNWVGYFSEGLASVYADNKGYNFIDTAGKIQFKKWYSSVGNFCEGLAMVEDNNKWNFIDKTEHIVFGQRFDKVREFSDGRAAVYIDGKGWNFINKKGEYISDRWYDLVCSFNNGVARVKLGSKYNLINTNGEPQYEQWEEYIQNTVQDKTNMNITNNIQAMKPSTWEEYCEQYPVSNKEYVITEDGDIYGTSPMPRSSKMIMPSQKSAEALVAFAQLIQLRDIYRNGWTPDWTDAMQAKYVIANVQGMTSMRIETLTQHMLSFQSQELCEKFLDSFGDLIETAKDLL